MGPAPNKLLSEPPITVVDTESPPVTVLAKKLTLVKVTLAPVLTNSAPPKPAPPPLPAPPVVEKSVKVALEMVVVPLLTKNSELPFAPLTTPPL